MWSPSSRSPTSTRSSLETEKWLKDWWCSPSGQVLNHQGWYLRYCQISAELGQDFAEMFIINNFKVGLQVCGAKGTRQKNVTRQDTQQAGCNASLDLSERKTCNIAQFFAMYVGWSWLTSLHLQKKKNITYCYDRVSLQQKSWQWDTPTNGRRRCELRTAGALWESARGPHSIPLYLGYGQCFLQVVGTSSQTSGAFVLLQY